MNKWKIFTNGIIKENPVFVLLLALCPLLGVTTSAINGLGMGLATTFVMIMCNIIIASIKNFKRFGYGIGDNLCDDYVQYYHCIHQKFYSRHGADSDFCYRDGILRNGDGVIYAGFSS